MLLGFQQYGSPPDCLFTRCLLYPAMMQEDDVGDLERMHIYVGWAVASKLFMAAYIRRCYAFNLGCPRSSHNTVLFPSWWHKLSGLWSLSEVGLVLRRSLGQAFQSYGPASSSSLSLLSGLLWGAGAARIPPELHHTPPVSMDWDLVIRSQSKPSSLKSLLSGTVAAAIGE